MKFTLKLLGIAVLLTVSHAATAVTAYSNFGTTDPGFSLNIGVAIVGQSNSFGYVEQGTLFTSEATGNLTEILLAAQRYAGPNYLAVSLYDDFNGSIGDLLATGVSTASIGGLHSTALTSFTGFNQVPLQLGEKYWLTARTIDNASIGWMLTTNQTIGSGTYRYSPDDTWTYVSTSPGAFLVSVSAVPEPGVWLMFALGIATLLSTRRKPSLLPNPHRTL